MDNSLYEMQGYEWWELMKWLETAQTQGYVTDSDLALIFPPDQLEALGENNETLRACSTILSLFEVMGIKLLDTNTRQELTTNNQTQH